MELPLYTMGPFLGILLSIAIMPLILPRFWHRYFPLISVFWALSFAVPFVCVYGAAGGHEILHIYLVDYLPFIILLWGLFTISGGILIEGTLRGTPLMNAAILLFGTLIASWIGTTGASMLMIRPILRANAWRERKIHVVVFFIFLVSNVGGSLTPLGDPPLFLGFLHNVPFFWTFNIFPHMSLVVLILLALFFVVDTIIYQRDLRAGDVKVDSSETVPLRLHGLHNSLFLLGVILGVLMSGLVYLGSINVLGVHMETQNILRDFILVTMGLLSLATTSKKIRQDNEFTWFPIKEVAYLFAGIFMTIIPALAILRSGEKGALAALIKALEKPDDFFWVTGSLSSFLDNAPTYLTFFNTALGKLGLNENMIREAFYNGTINTAYPEFVSLLTGISLGAVFMGANTYIGNAPNFMVKSIAEESGIKMPSFFGYMVKYSIPILVPLFIIVLWIF